MGQESHPALGVASVDAQAAVKAFAAGLQAGHDQQDAVVLNQQFADDVVWGSPFGALINGYERRHPIHVGFQNQEGERPRVRYEVRNVHPVSSDVVIAHIARLILGPDGEPQQPNNESDQPFSELAMCVLVRREGHWWLAAGQNTPMRRGGAVAPSV